MIILSIETSCDDTGVAILKYDKIGQPKILANLVSSQIKVHAPWGGVVPMLAKREHQRNLIPLLIKALKKISPSRPIRYPEPATRFAGVLARQVGDESSEKDSSATPMSPLLSGRGWNRRFG
ncbi:MAG: putative tRNA threonylcarbamoyladenosine biosynthesis protein Gcp [Parcubacteria group bacterium GW2011_GWA2_43_9b]|nr:MAG: putative tRNA threonylcarbamoyladenosine biosynthesis protein Gcp [Parcubacteria group bacterium GW2011_GWA2_43_9b]